VRVPDIRFDCYGLAVMMMLDVVHDPLCVLVGMGVVDDDLCAALGELDGDCCADASTTACNKGDFAV
jgi:hypothetical protein